MNAQEFRARVRAERRKRGWTQQDLENHSGVKKRNITSFENGHTNLQPANELRIREALDIWDDVDPEEKENDVAAATRAQWPDDVVVFSDVLSQWLSTLSDEERRVAMGDLFRWIMDRRQGNQSSS